MDTRDRIRLKLERDVADYLRRGGRIEQVPSGTCAGKLPGIANYLQDTDIPQGQVHVFQRGMPRAVPW